MPQRDDIQGPRGRGPGGSGPERGAPDSSERRTFSDTRFRTERQADFGHDENYRPGYHAGGTRFGFFGVMQGEDERPQTDQEFDPDYLGWRDRQMAGHDRDYADWRREQQRRYDDDYWRFRGERRDDFHQRFQDWRAQREAAAANPDDKL